MLVGVVDGISDVLVGVVDGISDVLVGVAEGISDVLVGVVGDIPDVLVGVVDGIPGGAVTLTPFSEVFTKVKVPNLLIGSLPLSEPSMSSVRR